MHSKQFGGDYDTTHAEIQLLFKLNILNSYTSKYGLIADKHSKTKNRKFHRKCTRKCRKAVPKCIYIIRVGHNGKLMYSRPCNHCLIVLKEVGIKSVVYSASKHTFKKEKL
mmetsp:Transcript_71010/g.112865  ORF Transcript_71010/g.112865 Transcript_71010/m.112865 type:complete len:111 (-) Transcript_71010:119-451(-)